MARIRDLVRRGAQRIRKPGWSSGDVRVETDEEGRLWTVFSYPPGNGVTEMRTRDAGDDDWEEVRN